MTEEEDRLHGTIEGLCVFLTGLEKRRFTEG
jgi:hypothetical protein